MLLQIKDLNEIGGVARAKCKEFRIIPDLLVLKSHQYPLLG